MDAHFRQGLPRKKVWCADALVALFQPKSRYYMVISPKLSSDTLVALFQPKSRYYLVISPKLSSDALEALFQPKSGYYMVISPKLSSDALGALFQPKSMYYMVVFPKLTLLPWYPLDKLSYGHFLKIIISFPGTPVSTRHPVCPVST